MSALPKPTFPVQNYSPHSNSARSRQRKKYRSHASSFHSKTKQVSNSSVTKLPNKKTLPVQLQILLFLQKSSFGLALVLIASSIAVYISNVRIPQLWSKEYNNLETLQRQERELIAINESLKHEIAQQAQAKNTKFVSLTVDNAIFVRPASVSSSINPNPIEQVQVKDLELELNSGY
jgi:NADH:ubiquinone oxidoreductase subunit 5 (subunit L)/multisubunit Na+/H+ antiporter MnhA subunit